MAQKLLLIFFVATTALSLKLFLIGGASDETSKATFEQLARTVVNRPPKPNACDPNWATTTCPRIAVATSAATDSAAGNEAYSDDRESMSYATMFKLYGMAPIHLTIHRDNYKIHGNTSTPEGMANLKILQQADIVFFNGGDQARHIRTWLNDDASMSPLLTTLKARAFNNQIVLAGTSAGSMIWSNLTYGGGDSFGILYFKNSIGLAPKAITDGGMGGSGFDDIRNGTSSLQYQHNGGKMPGFSFTNFTVDTHFNARGRIGRLAPVLVDTKQQLGIGIDENTSFYYNDGAGTVYGYNGVSIFDLEKALVYPMSYFTINGIIGHYLTAGDRYDFNYKKVISSKPLITSPAYTGFTDSSNILAAYEATLLETRLVDQKSLYNVGRTKSPSDFSKGTPTFEIKFYRGAQSQGYYGNKQYTVSSILYDFSFGANHNHLTRE